MSYPVGTVAVSTTSDGSTPVWVMTPSGWQYLEPLTGFTALHGDITDNDFDTDWIFIQPENPLFPVGDVVSE